MENSIVVALTRQDTLRRQLDVVANNLANVNTTAFKGERLLFVEHLVPTSSSSPSIGGTLSLVRDIATTRDLAMGDLQETGGDLDLAIAGDGYLTVETPEGTRYTRNGRLQLNENGELVTAHGLPVLAQGARVQLGIDDTQITIARDGTISSESRDLAKLDVVRFNQPQRLSAIGGGLMSAGDERPEAVVSPVVLQGKLEGSNVEPISEIERLIELQRAYDQARQLVDREDDRIRKMLQTYAG